MALPLPRIGGRSAGSSPSSVILRDGGAGSPVTLVPQFAHWTQWRRIRQTKSMASPEAITKSLRAGTRPPGRRAGRAQRVFLSRGLGTGHRRGHPLLHLLAGHVLDMGADRPLMAEGVLHLAETVAP